MKKEDLMVKFLEGRNLAKKLADKYLFVRGAAKAFKDEGSVMLLESTEKEIMRAAREAGDRRKDKKFREGAANFLRSFAEWLECDKVGREDGTVHMDGDELKKYIMLTRGLELVAKLRGKRPTAEQLREYMCKWREENKAGKNAKYEEGSKAVEHSLSPEAKGRGIQRYCKSVGFEIQAAKPGRKTG